MSHTHPNYSYQFAMIGILGIALVLAGMVLFRSCSQTPQPAVHNPGNGEFTLHSFSDGGHRHYRITVRGNFWFLNPQPRKYFEQLLHNLPADHPVRTAHPYIKSKTPGI